MAQLQSTDTYTKFISDFTSLGGRVPAIKSLVPLTIAIREKIAAIVSALADYKSGTTASIVLPYSEILDLKSDIKALIIQAGPVLDIPFDFILLLRETIRQLSNLSLIKEIFVSREQALEAVVNVFSNTPIPKKTYKIAYGDTLIGIANRLMPSTARDVAVAQIVALNNLDYPYIVTDQFDEPSDPLLNIVKAGDSIFVPHDAQANLDNAIIPNREEEFASLFGTDIQLNGYSSVVRDPTAGSIVFNESGDLSVVKGVDNLVQALQLRILTDRGSLPLHPTFGAGFRKFIGQTGEGRHVQLAAFEVGRAVVEDPRVASVQDLSGTMDSNALTALIVRFTAQIIGSDSPLSLNLVIPQ